MLTWIKYKRASFLPNIIFFGSNFLLRLQFPIKARLIFNFQLWFSTFLRQYATVACSRKVEIIQLSCDSMQQSHVAQISPFTARFCRTSHVFVASCKRALILQEAMFTTRKGLWLNVQVASRHLVRYGQLLNIADCCYWVCFGVFLYHGQWPANAVYFLKHSPWRFLVVQFIFAVFH